MLVSADSGLVAHFILMRFNVRTRHRAEARDAAIRSQQNWLETRFALFERYCWPTLAAQTCKAFELHVYFDETTPKNYLKRFDDIVSSSSFAKRFTCEYFDNNLVVTDIRSKLLADTKRVLTTRLDNDDGLHCDFVQTVQNNVGGQSKEALNFPIGLVVRGSAAYLSRQESNAFISLVEDASDFRTVLQTSHNQIGKLFSIRNISHQAMWLQHVHGGNVSNKIRGQRLTRNALPPGFESVHLSSHIKPVTHVAAAFENATSGLYRSGRDLTAKTLRVLRLR